MTPHRKKFHKEALNTKNALFFPNKGIKYDGPLPLELFDANGQTYSRYTDVQTPSSSTSSEPSTAPSSPSVSTPLTLPADLSPPSPRVDASKDPMESFSSAASGYSPPTTLSYPSSCRSSSPTGSSLVSAENESWSRFKSLVDTAANMPRLPIIGAGGMP